MRKIAICLLTAVAASAAAAFSAHHESGQPATYRVQTEKGTVEVIPLTDDIFRICRLPSYDAPTPKPTQAASLTPQKCDITTWADGSQFIVQSPTTVIRVNKNSGNVSFYAPSSELLLTEADGISRDGDEQTATFITPEEDYFYGGGERGHSLTLNGTELPMWNRANYGYTDGDPRLNQNNISIPYLVSDNGYGILMDDYAKAQLTVGEDTIRYRTISRRPLSYYFINGEGSLADVTVNFTRLTGRQALPRSGP